MGKLERKVIKQIPSIRGCRRLTCRGCQISRQLPESNIGEFLHINIVGNGQSQWPRRALQGISLLCISFRETTCSARFLSAFTCLFWISEKSSRKPRRKITSIRVTFQFPNLALSRVTMAYLARRASQLFPVSGSVWSATTIYLCFTSSLGFSRTRYRENRQGN